VTSTDDGDPEDRLRALSWGPPPFASTAVAAAELRRRFDLLGATLRDGRITPLEAARASAAIYDDVESRGYGVSPSDAVAYRLAQVDLLEVRAAFLGEVASEADDPRFGELARVATEICAEIRALDGPPDWRTGEPRAYFDLAVRSQQLTQELGLE